MSDRIVNATDTDFDAAGLGKGLHLVDFWADWCGPCKALAPTLSDLADDFGDDLAVVKVDIVANPATAQRFNVSSIPLLILFRDGQEVARHLGATTRGRLTAMVEGAL